MPNWCYTRIAVFQKEESEAAKAQLMQLYERIENLRRTQDPGYYGARLPELLEQYGVDSDKVYCRGHILDTDADLPKGSYFIAYEEDAWGPMTDAWDKIMEKHPLLSYVFTAEEPGMDIFVTTDREGRFFTERFMLDYSFNCMGEHREDCEYFETEKDLLEYAAKLLGHEISSLTELQDCGDKIQEESPDAFFSVHKFEVA